MQQSQRVFKLAQLYSTAVRQRSTKEKEGETEVGKKSLTRENTQQGYLVTYKRGFVNIVQTVKIEYCD